MFLRQTDTVALSFSLVLYVSNNARNRNALSFPSFLPFVLSALLHPPNLHLLLFFVLFTLFPFFCSPSGLLRCGRGIGRREEGECRRHPPQRKNFGYLLLLLPAAILKNASLLVSRMVWGGEGGNIATLAWNWICRPLLSSGRRIVVHFSRQNVCSSSSSLLFLIGFSRVDGFTQKKLDSIDG